MPKQSHRFKHALSHRPDTKIPSAPALAWLGFAYGHIGHRENAKEILIKLEQASAKKYVSPYALALVHFGLEEQAQGFQLLEEAAQDRSFWLAFFAPLTMRLAGAEYGSRSLELLQRMNLR
ncbi:MAG: hypothetical protein M3Y72_12945 [Acidobacteriota bacterium]|nr:hypothetical protein [Acidobacteriota bacterium]